MISFKIQNKTVPALGFGTWKLKGQTGVDAVKMALKLGYRHIDTAQIYENEVDVGVAIKESGVKREDIFLTTKVWMSNVAPGDFQRSVETSLRALQTDYVDLLLLHWPVPSVPLADQVAALREMRDTGRAVLIGVSNYTVPLLQEACDTLGVPVANNQVEYHPFLSQKPVLDFARNRDMFVTAYSPLARGQINHSPVLAGIGKAHGKNAGQVTLRWLLQQEKVAAIPKAASPENITANFDIFDFALSDAEMGTISALARADGRLVNPDWAPLWDKAA